MRSLSITLLALALAACAHGAAVQDGRSKQVPQVWPMPSLGVRVSPEIIGGDRADRGEFPHQVSMQISMLWLIEQHICGGTIINESWILTAAHCVKGTPWYTSNFILAGKSSLGSKEEGQQRRTIKKKFVHEKYEWNQNGGVGPYDIALLQLSEPLVFSDTVQPAKLPAQDAIPSGDAILTGWGSTSKTSIPSMPDWLQKVTLPVIPYEKCDDFFADMYGTLSNPLKDTNVCVGDLEVAGKGACNGDSGGPLVQKDADNKYTVIGATSWGSFPCQSQPSPSVYTRVSAYVDWIQDKMAHNK